MSTISIPLCVHLSSPGARNSLLFSIKILLNAKAAAQQREGKIGSNKAIRSVTILMKQHA